jgi:energy-coupling factor transport system ATP-binding protein
MMEMINVENIHFKYKREKEVISNLNLKINEGECIAIVGRNGSGKSTLARLISGIIKPTKGNIIVDEINTKDKKNYINLRKKIGIVFQNPENQILFNNIDDELAFALKNLNLEDRAIRINQALEKVKIEKEKIGDIDELSLGQKQRIAIAGVLAVNPKYIVLDEPTTMIDSEGKEAVYSIIKTLKNSGYTIIYITNNTEEIFLADRIIILDEGKIAETILKEDLVNKTEILSNYNLKIPIETLILKMLNENNIKINPAEPGVYGIIKELIRRVKV